MGLGLRRLYHRVGDLLTSGRRKPLQDDPLPLPDHLVALTSPEGAALLDGAASVGDFHRLWPHFEPQLSPTLCGPATMSMMLNAFGVAPNGADRFTQIRVFTRATEAVKPRRLVEKEGMGLAIIADYLAAHGLKAELHFAGETSIDAFRAAFLSVLDDPDRFIAVNYSRTAIGQEGKGHVSPLGAYDAASDRVLVLDVSRHRYPPVWAPIPALHAAMNTPVGQTTRGYAIVSRAA